MDLASATYADPAQGEDSQRDTTAIMWGRTPYPYPGQNLGTGNRCGHNPDSPEFHLFSEPKWFADMPSPIRKLMDAAQAYYDAPLETLPSLANLNGRRNKTGVPRKNRSEARVAEILITHAVFSCTEFSSLRVGTPKGDGGFIPRSCVELARIAGLLKKKKSDEEEDEPSPRFWRGFRRLRIAGAFDVHLQYEQMADGSKRGRPAIKRVNPNFLIALGAISYQALERFRTHCSNQVKKLRREYRARFPVASDANTARKQLRREQGDSGVRTFTMGHRKQQEHFKKTARDVYQQEILSFQAELAKRHPELTPRDIGLRAMKEFPVFNEWERVRQNE
ncbi:plasmid replication protein repA (plasmid) [Pseudomonas antarctica]|uniref:Plasmid replication protein repA n=2 Tax=Pseudomonas antarctica TaxID=219572 RepID=A0A172ZB95_9PSED|nr:plasmid replication protein repA [Pseudomonas antarctica]